MEGTNIIPISIEDEMRGSYLDYAMSVIIGRAIPDARDGLKPVHRRILYAMLREGLLSNRKFSKCAGVVGEVLKHYHPHGDSAVYNALVRMAQGWNLRYPLIDGQGNFGSIDGDAAAAYRYTESRMTALAEALLADIDEETVDFVPNFDESTEEPVVLPSRVPHLLINGAEGIAVGMASSIPPHNLREIVQATIKLIRSPEVSVAELMEIVPGPDFPTAGIICGAEPLRAIYETGKGIFKVRGKVRVETNKAGREAILIDEIPYQVNKAKLIEKIAELVNDKKLDGIAKLRDESDRKGMRVVIELKKDAPSDVVLNQLYAQTPLERTFGVIMLSIVEGRPQVLGLKAMLQCFVDHRRTVILRRSKFRLNKAEARQHILEGLRIALENIDEVVATIKASESTQEAKEKLQKKFALSEIQAQQILDMPLRRLTGLERKAIDEEYEELGREITQLKKILSDPKEVDRITIEELEEISEKFGDDRRTVIEEAVGEIDLEDMIIEEDMVVTVSHKGYIKRCSPKLYRSQRRGGKGVRGTKRLTDEESDFVTDLFVASTHAYLLVFTSKGRLHWVKVYNLPEMGRTARGRAIVNMLKLNEDERVSAILPVRHFQEGKTIVFATRRGLVKRVELMAFSNIRRGGIRATKLDDGDELIAVKLTDGTRDCILATKRGMAIRFHENRVRVMGRITRGVRGVTLSENDDVVNLITVPQSAPFMLEANEAAGASEEDDAGEEEVIELEEVASEGEDAGDDDADDSQVEEKDEIALFTVCENGYGKRTRASRYRTQGRGGKGIIDIKTEGRNGFVVDTYPVVHGDQVMIVTSAGNVIRMPVKGIRLIGRNTMGVRLINLSEGEKVAAVGRIADSDEESDQPPLEPSAA